MMLKKRLSEGSNKHQKSAKNLNFDAILKEQLEEIASHKQVI